VKIYTFYIEDDRYGVRTLLTGQFADDACALAHIPRLLGQSRHYVAIEIWDGDRQVTPGHRPRRPGKATERQPDSP
jgi:hypothetical protein